VLKNKAFSFAASDAEWGCISIRPYFVILGLVPRIFNASLTSHWRS